MPDLRESLFPSCFQKEYGKNSSKLHTLLIKVGKYYNHNEDIEKAIAYNSRALRIAQLNNNKKHEAFALARLSIDYAFLIRPIESSKYIKEALGIAEDYFFEDHYIMYLIYMGASIVYAKSDPEKFYYYSKEAIKKYEQSEYQEPGAESMYRNLGNYYSNRGDYKNALKYYHKALEKANEFGKSNPFSPSIYLNLAGVYYKKGDVKKAVFYYNKSIKGFEGQGKGISIEVAHNYINMTKLYRYVANDLIKAEESVKKSISIYEKVVEPNSTHLIRAYLNWAIIARLNKNYEVTKKCFAKVHKKFEKEHVEALNFDGLMKREMLSFYFEAQAFFYKDLLNETHDEKYADLFSDALDKFLTLEEHILKTETSQFAKESRQSHYLHMYKWKIEHILKYSPDNSEKAFSLAEKTKSRLILEGFYKNDRKYELGVPEQLLKKQQELLKKKTTLINDKFKEQSKGQFINDSLIAHYDSQLFELIRADEALQETFKKDHPTYYNLMYNHEVVDVKTVQDNLQANQSLVEYFVTDELLFIYLIDADSFTVQTVVLDATLKQWVTKLREGIYNYWSIPTSDEDLLSYDQQYRKVAHQLYQKLIAPVAAQLKSNVIIVPDAELNFIPFDALLTEAVEDQTDLGALPYLIRKHNISYNYSATLHDQLVHAPKKEAKKQVLAFAPMFKDTTSYTTPAMRRSGLGELKHNVEEVERIDDYYRTSLYVNEQATKSNFLDQAQAYSILHLSTHAKANDKFGDYSYVAFSKANDSLPDDKLYVSELYNLHLNADMVVLSACESGIGQLRRGEGVISLARAFTYAGANSTITSLWNVNDSQTSNLMALFYENLKLGLPKDQALRQAKLSYLDNETLKAPYFWASFIPAGNMTPIAIPEQSYGWYWLLSLLVVGPLLIFFFRKRRS